MITSIGDYLFWIAITPIKAAGSAQVMENLVRISDTVHPHTDWKYVPDISPCRNDAYRPIRSTWLEPGLKRLDEEVHRR